jgi:hypothetical protein
MESLEKQLEYIEFRTTEAKVSYAVSQLMRFLREDRSRFDIPINTTQQIVRMFKDIAFDDKMYPLLLNKEKLKNILKSMVAKEPLAASAFSKIFDQSMQLFSTESSIKKRNGVMKHVGDLIDISRFSHGWTDPEEDTTGETVGEHRDIGNIIDEFHNFLKGKGYDVDSIPGVASAIKIVSGKKKKPARKLVVKEIIDRIKESANKHASMQYREVSTIGEDEEESGFRIKDFTKDWTRMVIDDAYGRPAPSFSLAIEEFINWKSKEAKGIPNAFMGALNDYLIEKRGKSNVPRVYDFPLDDLNVDENIDNQAKNWVLALLKEEASMRSIHDGPMLDYKTIIERTMFTKSFKKHLHSRLTSVDFINDDLTEDMMATIGRKLILLGAKDKKITKELQEGEEENRVRKIKGLRNKQKKQMSLSISSMKIDSKEGGSVLNVGKDWESSVFFAGKMLEKVIKKKNIIWNGKKIETIEEFLVYNQYFKNLDKSVPREINKALDDALKNLDDVKDFKLTKKELNELRDEIKKIKDQERVKDRMKDLLKGNDVDLDGKDFDDLEKTTSLLPKKNRDQIKDKIRKQIDKGKKKLTGKDKEEIIDAIEQISSRSLMDKLKKAVEDAKDWDDLERMDDLISQIDDKDARNHVKRTSKKSRIPRDKFNDLLDDIKNANGPDVDNQVSRMSRKKGFQLTGEKLDELDDESSSIKDDDVKNRIKNKISGIRKRNEKRANKELLDEIEKMVITLEKSAKKGKKDKGTAGSFSKGEWDLTEDLIKFLKEKMKAVRAGMEDISSIFQKDENGSSIIQVIQRAAKMPGAEKLAFEMIRGMHKLFNDFKERSSDLVSKNIFKALRNQFRAARNQIDYRMVQIETDAEYKRLRDEANASIIKAKEEYDKIITEGIEWFVTQGKDPGYFYDLVQKKAREEIINRKQGNQIIPPARAIKLVFDSEARRRFAAFSATTKRKKFRVPKVSDISIIPGSNINPYNSAEFMGKKIGGAVSEEMDKTLSIQDGKVTGGPSGPILPPIQHPPPPGPTPPPPTEEWKKEQLAKKKKELEERAKITARDVAEQHAKKMAAVIRNQFGDAFFPPPPPPPPPPGPQDIPVFEDDKLEGDPEVPDLDVKPPTGGDGPRIQVEKKKWPSMIKEMNVDAIKKMLEGEPDIDIDPIISGDGDGNGKSFVKKIAKEEFIDINDLKGDMAGLINEKISEAAIAGALVDPEIGLSPEYLLDDNTVISNKEVKDILEKSAKTPENVAYLRRLFRLSFRNDYAEIRRLGHGNVKTSLTDRQRFIRSNMRHGQNPRTKGMMALDFPKRRSKPIKRDIFSIDVSGSMTGFTGILSQIIAALSEPRFTKISLFDQNAIMVDSKVFGKDPAGVILHPNLFGNVGGGSTSYDAALDILNKEKITKTDRIIMIGDMEDNTQDSDASKKIRELEKIGACKGKWDCISTWFKHLCEKADSCIAIQPKQNISPGSDITCNLLEHKVPVCLTGALIPEGNVRSRDYKITGKGLKRTVECLKNGMTGSSPKIPRSVALQCGFLGNEGTTKSFDISSGIGSDDMIDIGLLGKRKGGK